MTFGIIGNNGKEKIPDTIQKLCRDLKKEKINFIVEEKLSNLITKRFKLKFSRAEKSAKAQLVTKCDFIISIGGDGTFLSTAKLVGKKGKPIIGVNFGKLGFLAENTEHDIISFIKDIIKGKYFIDERTVLEATVNGTKKTIFGINEIVINQSGIVKTIQITVNYNDQLLNSYHADGLIVATPTGSTAYSLSAGGPIVHPDTSVLILSPLCPHTLTARTVVLPDDGIIEVNVLSRIPFNVIADGHTYVRKVKNTVVEIKKAPYTIKLAKSLSSNYFKVLNKKLLWGEDRRKSISN